METTQEQKMDEKLRQSEAREERFQHLFRHLLHMLEKFIAIITLVVLLAAMGREIVELILHPGATSNVSGFLHEILTIVVGLEFVRMLIDRHINSTCACPQRPALPLRTAPAPTFSARRTGRR